MQVPPNGHFRIKDFISPFHRWLVIIGLAHSVDAGLSEIVSNQHISLVHQLRRKQRARHPARRVSVKPQGRTWLRSLLKAEVVDDVWVGEMMEQRMGRRVYMWVAPFPVILGEDHAWTSVPAKVISKDEVLRDTGM